MKPIPVGEVLTEFGVKPASKEKKREPERKESVKKPAPIIEKAPSIMEETLVRGIEQGRAAVLAEMDTKLEEQRRFYEQKLELERCTWVSREADVFVQQLADGLDTIQSNIAELTARILKPFLVEQIREQGLASLVETLDVLLFQDKGLTLEVSGPEDFLQLLREKLSSKNVTAVFSPGDDVEVRVRVGQTFLETQFGAWLARLEELVK